MLIRVDDWRRARARMLLYLQALHIPPEMCRRLIHEAWEQARARTQSPPAPRDVMPALFAILNKHGLISDGEPDFNARRWRLTAKNTGHANLPELPQGPQGSLASIALPPTRRRPLPPAPMEPAPWRDALARWSQEWSLQGLYMLRGQANVLTILLLVVVLWLAGV
jgi:hypothetical protein